MKNFSKLFEKVDSTTSTNEKVEAMVEYFKSEPKSNIVWAITILTEKIRKRTMTSQQLREACQEFFKIPDWLFRECYAHVGDSAETITLLLQNIKFERKEHLDISLAQWMTKEIPSLAELTEAEKGARIFNWWSRLNPQEVFILNKLMTGGFRFGVSEKLVYKALAKAFDIPANVIQHKFMGKVNVSPEFLESILGSQEVEVQASQPYPFYLAHSLDEERFQKEDYNEWIAEWKWDGIRSQYIKRQKEIFVWSRGEDLITEKFPELHRDLQQLPDGTVLDGEIVAWRDQVLPFQVLQTRIGRKTVSKKVLEDAPVASIIFDVLEYKGEDIRTKPLCERKKILDQIFLTHSFDKILKAETIEFKDFDTLKSLRDGAREKSVEGLMLKRKTSEYGVGRKVGDWWKFKVDPYTLDAVLLYAQAGSGKRANLFTDYTFALWHKDKANKEQLIPFAKAYSGLDNEEIEELDRWIRQHTKEKFGPVRSVEPKHVFEISFEGITLSSRHKSGIAVRFPRITRWRKDKAIKDADTLESAKKWIP